MLFLILLINMVPNSYSGACAIAYRLVNLHIFPHLNLPYNKQPVSIQINPTVYNTNTIPGFVPQSKAELKKAVNTCTKRVPKDNCSNRRFQISKTLTYALRHGAEKLKLNMNPDGFVAVSELLKLKKFRGSSLEVFQSIVANCPKQRFGLKQEAGQWFIRANQGHSTKRVETDELLTPIKSSHEIPTGICIHGTYRSCLEEIEAKGLSRMKRNHIHFTPHLVTDPTRPHSGFRASCDTLIYLNVDAVLAADIKLYISSNGVVLSPGNKDGFIPPQFFAKIVDRETHASVSSRGLTIAKPLVPSVHAPPLPTPKADGASMCMNSMY